MPSREARRQLARQQQLANVQLQFQQTVSTGPLPPAKQIEEYEQVVPGSGEILFQEFQAQSIHRRQMERVVVWSDAIRSFFGMAIGFILAGYIIYTGGELLREGHSTTGFAAIGTAVAIAVGPFLVKNYLNSKERRAQQQAIAAVQKRK